MKSTITTAISLIVALLLTNCQNAPKQAAKTSINNSNPHLTTTRKTNVYDSPNGQVIDILPPGRQILLNGRYSPLLYPLNTSTDSLIEPYIEIIIDSHSTAWVYADPANFSLPNSASSWQWNNRIQSILKDDVFKQYKDLTNYWFKANHANVLFLLFQLTKILRPQLSKAINEYPRLAQHVPDNLLPATIPYKEHRSISWWINFNAWYERSLTTPELDDDALFDFYRTAVYPPDSIEYRYTAWQFPVDVKSVHSLLGKHVHFSLLQQLDSLQTQYPGAQNEWQELRTSLIDDIIDPEQTFWNDAASILQELQQIIHHPWQTIDKHHLELLQQLSDDINENHLDKSRLNYRDRP